MLHGHILLKLAATHPNKGDSVPMARVHICLELKHKTTKSLPNWIYSSRARLAGDWSLGQLKESIQEWPHAEVSHGRAKKYGTEITGMHQLQIQFGACPIEQLQLLQGSCQQLRLHQTTEFGLLHREPPLLTLATALGPLKQHHLLAAAINHAPEAITTADRPIHRPTNQAQLLLQFIEQFQGFPPRPVHFVDKGENRNAPQATNLKQLAGLGL